MEIHSIWADRHSINYQSVDLWVILDNIDCTRLIHTPYVEEAFKLAVF